MRPFHIQQLSLLASFVSFGAADRLWPIQQTASPGALKYQPTIDFDGSACFFTAAIDAIDGRLNPGVEVSRHPDAPKNPWECRGIDRALAANTYVREKCTDDGWCAYLYGYYFEKDEGGSLDWGHKHDWEHIMVWTLNGDVKWLGWSAHGDYSVAKAENVEWDENHPKFVVHRGGGTTHSFRRATAGEPPENPAHQWIRGQLVSIETMDGKKKEDMLRHDWGSAHTDLDDVRFVKAYWGTWNQIKN